MNTEEKIIKQVEAMEFSPEGGATCFDYHGKLLGIKLSDPSCEWQEMAARHSMARALAESVPYDSHEGHRTNNGSWTGFKDGSRIWWEATGPQAGIVRALAEVTT